MVVLCVLSESGDKKPIMGKKQAGKYNPFIMKNGRKDLEPLFLVAE